MTCIIKAGIAVACGALIAGAGITQPALAQQQPPAATTTPQTTPAQPGPLRDAGGVVAVGGQPAGACGGLAVGADRGGA